MAFFPFIKPAMSEKIPIRTTLRNKLGQQVIATRKLLEVYHQIVYSYDIMPIRYYEIIEAHFGQVDGGVNSFDIVDWGRPKLVVSISGSDLVLNSTHNLSINTGDGGNRIILWEDYGDYGDDSTVVGSSLTDKTKAWPTNVWQNYKLLDSGGTELNIVSNTSNTIVVSGTPNIGSYIIYRYETFTIDVISGRTITVSSPPTMTFLKGYQEVYPVYTGLYQNDQLQLKPTGDWNDEINDNYGPYYSGTITFIQQGTG